MKQTYAAKYTNVRRLDGVVVLKPHGNMMGGDETDELEKLIQDFDNESIPCLVVNLVDVGMVNSLAISKLIAGHVKFARRKARMSLCSLDARIQNILVITKLSQVFDVFANEEAAIEGCTGGAE